MKCRALGAVLVVLLGLGNAFALGDVVLELAPGDGNPRNSEGDFIPLKDGRILFIYTHFTGGIDDDTTAHLASRVSTDGGVTWSSEDRVVVPNEGKYNIMSVSLLRLDNDEIGLFYLRKDAENDCRAYLRRSADEGETWSNPEVCTPELGYYVVNNDRILRTSTGTIVIPAALHTFYNPTFTGRGAVLCYLSSDNGKTWRRSKTTLEPPAESKSGLQEPGLIELKDGRLMMLMRTDQGCQMQSFSSDGGDTWSPAETTDILSPVSPATLARIPGTDELVMVWNDHSRIDPGLKGKRTPLTLAISADEGKTWERRVDFETSPTGWYCYTAIHFTDKAMLLGYCAGNTEQENGLARTRIRRIPLDQLPQKD